MKAHESVIQVMQKMHEKLADNDTTKATDSTENATAWS